MIYYRERVQIKISQRKKNRRQGPGVQNAELPLSSLCRVRMHTLPALMCDDMLRVFPTKEALLVLGVWLLCGPYD